MKVNVFNGYYDTDPKESTLEEIVRLVKQDATLKERTKKHRYYLEKGFIKEAKAEKAAGLNLAVAARFRGGKEVKHIHELTFIGMVEFDHLAADEMPALLEKVRKDRHMLMEHVSIGGSGVHVLFFYVVNNLTDADRNRYADIYGAAFDVACVYYSLLTGKEVDKNCRKCTQLNGLAWDEEVLYQPDAVPFEVVLPPVSEGKKPHRVSLAKVVKVAKAQLAEEGIVFKEGSRNEFLMRMGYLMNAYGVPQDDATEWAIGKYGEKYDGDLMGIFQSCYKHTEEHGTLKLPKQAVKGERWASVEEIERFIGLQMAVRYNVVRRQCEVAWKDGANVYTPITDRDESTLWSRMMKQGMAVRLQDIRNVLQSEFVPLFNPFVAYFEALPPWDGVTDYIGQLARMVHVKGDQELFVEYFRKWLVGILPTIFDEQVVNHEIMVFIGRQGNYKSTFFSLLLPPPLQSYFHLKMNHNHLNKDDMLVLCENALVCLEEIDELKPADLNQLKALVTARCINERAAYARNKERRAHIASFCGTGNNPHFLSDPTDNRRWLVVEVLDIDDPHLQPFNYTGIYSQALALWKSGFRYWFNQQEIRVLNERNREFEVPNLEEELVLTYFRPPFPGSKPIFMKVANILERINGCIRQPLSPNRLGIMMRKLGFQPHRINGQRGFLVIERMPDEIQASRKVDGSMLDG